MNASEDMPNLISNQNVQLQFIDRLIGRTLKQKMHNHNFYQQSKNLNINNIKIDGRYPFKETFFFTEFFAGLFSLSNLIMHLIFYNILLTDIQKSNLHSEFRNQLIISCCGWISSTLFHMNDIFITRCFDYFFAFLFLVYGNYLSFKRILMSKYKKQIVERYSDLFLYLGMVYYVFHVFYMAVINFNYDYSRKVSVLLFLLWLTQSFFQVYIGWTHVYSKYFLSYLILVTIGGIVEYFDFPPWNYLIDSHAAWHGVTALAVPLYYLFVSKDIPFHVYIDDKKKL